MYGMPLGAIMKVTKKQHVLEAFIWNVNGDIPNEVTEVFKDGEYAGEFYEGSVVRYFRSPDISGTSLCPKCGKTYHEHGWIDQDENGITVCPGSYVIKYSDVEYAVLSPDAFEKLYVTVDTTEPVLNSSFQQRAHNFFTHCFGEQFPELLSDRQENQHRFLEESLEFVQSLGMTEAEAIALVAYVFSRPVGEPALEAGGVCTTLSILTHRYDINLIEAAEAELKRNYIIIDKIREKQQMKDELGFKNLRGNYER